MVSKILTLFDIEFKRIQKVFFTVLSLLTLGNIIILAYNLYVNVKMIENDYNVSLGMKVLNTDVGRDMFITYNVSAIIYIYTFALMVLALIWCGFYSVRIWNRDFSDKSKSIYTLFMLPENKFIIFLSKLLTIVILAYGIILVQHICWTIDTVIISNLTNLSIDEVIACINTAQRSFVELEIMSVYPFEFFINYMIAPIAIVIVIFTGVLMSKSTKKGGSVLGVIFVISIWMVHSSSTILNGFYSDKFLISTILSYIFISLICIGISYNILNKQVYA